ncbi:three-Cys-motif partner protein TcmP [Kribbella speibonae]|uniref:Three-Cys-motif partner protein TcmP n=1 Tax=Kribbella speibonae TaxID=1572660 RepID=A0A4R0ICR0_9ACTN|nr:three-Cys-motif partner protein TcmP [Kribbella speibonae]TCC29680.1 three-Cys-motif partner protein TcmP [Kribbella speibonae]
MASKNPVPWAADPHTKAKHALYTSYLGKWMPIMVNGWGANITYAEGFAGPGVYLDGSPGSPVIALRTLVADPSIRTKVRLGGMRFVFIDRDQRCIDMLPTELAKAAVPVPLDQLAQHGIHVAVEKGQCEPHLQQLLTREKAWKRPILAVLDTWGGAVSFDLVKRIADNPGSEVIITMQPQYFSRFAEVDDIEHGDRVFGGISWRAVAQQSPEAKERWLLQSYRHTIQAAGFPYVLDFELVDKRGQSLFLVFGTTHPKGLIKMKEAMWEVDAIGGIGYRDPRDPNQETLAIEFEPQTAPLKRLILDHLRTLPGTRSPIYELRRFALFSTVFKESQAMSVVRELVASGSLVRADGVTTAAGLRFQHVVSLPT